MHASQDEDAAVLFNFAPNLTGQIRRLNDDLARCQRAGKGARESPAGGRDDVIEGGRVRLQNRRIDPVVFGNRSVRTEEHRLGFSGHHGAPEWTPQAPNGTLRRVHDFRHAKPPIWQ